MRLCSDCGKECEVIWIDVGIGPFEFWGAKGVDRSFQCVSLCCEAPMHDEDGKEIDYDDQAD